MVCRRGCCCSNQFWRWKRRGWGFLQQRRVMWELTVSLKRRHACDVLWSLEVSWGGVAVGGLNIWSFILLYSQEMKHSPAQQCYSEPHICCSDIAIITLMRWEHFQVCLQPLSAEHIHHRNTTSDAVLQDGALSAFMSLPLFIISHTLHNVG